MMGRVSGNNIMQIQDLVNQGCITLLEGITEIAGAVERSPAFFGSPFTFEKALDLLKGSETIHEFNINMDFLLETLVSHFTGRPIQSLTKRT